MAKLITTTFHCESAMFIIIIILCLLNSYSFAATTTYNVINFGAKPNGVTDSTKGFLNAWSVACASTSTSVVILVPKGRYLLGPIAFKGECKSSDVTFQIDGTLVAPVDYRILGQVDDWLSFDGVSGVSIIGGALDANGPALWACKATGQDCPSGATVSIYKTFLLFLVPILKMFQFINSFFHY